MIWALVIAGGILALMGAAALVRALQSPLPDSRHDGKGSIMEPEPLHMSLFSADNVRLLSDAQIRAIEHGVDDAE